ncbi:helix-turn-helix domain-containing protein [Chitinophaga japonensis]|uniref:AraC-like DNA-binding protein n=1 Tax=Chitinophaga japonensis TaxID=104662 RepID=A0A562T403_CHIJA|nr:AraC family transcriptional regulator [Chitinophaga japonensis]TWI88267.1 AraC-like DNA-binding protein [Chitinophaga japonensis]
MDADIHTLYQSDFYRILDFKCRCTDCRTSQPEYNETFCISFVRKGNFIFNVFRHALDSYNGCVLITKPGYERTVTHAHAVPDECTIFEISNDFYPSLLQRYRHTRFFADNDLHSTLIRTGTETEFLHFYILQQVLQRSGSKLQADQLVMEMIDKVLHAVTDYRPDTRISSRLKQQHLTTIERAKAYITANFAQDISLMEIAAHCFVSPFHFSRIFKTFTSCTPHQFLLSIRLQHAAMVLRDTSVPVADAAFSSGFNSIEYFTAAFRQQYRCPPARYRTAQAARFSR